MDNLPPLLLDMDGQILLGKKQVRPSSNLNPTPIISLENSGEAIIFPGDNDDQTGPNGQRQRGHLNFPLVSTQTICGLCERPRAPFLCAPLLSLLQTLSIILLQN